ncbi:MAG: hypothetical protein WBG71_11930 [Leeuwenhoekiella sp.]
MVLAAANLQGQEKFSDNLIYGGNLGMNFGNGFFSVTVAPSALYRFNKYIASGPSIIYSYVKQSDFKTSMYGGSWITLVDPLNFLQLSAELEQLRVNVNSTFVNDRDSKFWNTALFLGGGLRSGLRNGNVVVGLRYNVLFNSGNRVYAEAYQPFVRVYF